MKFNLILILFLISVFNSSAQEWITSFDEAKNLAAEQNKLIVLVFQGSDWCAPCMKLDKEIWSTEEYQNLAKDRLIMLKADFPRRKANKLSKELQDHNNSLAETYNKNGYFPLVVVLDKEGKVLRQMGYEKTSPTDYFNKLSSF